MIEKTIGFIGAGNMAEALIRGLIETNQCKADNIILNDINEIRLAHMAKNYGVGTIIDQKKLIEKCTVLILAVKPQQMLQMLEEVKDAINPLTHTVISIAAGITTIAIEKRLGGMMRIIRVMPNTAARFLEGAAAYCMGKYANENDEVVARKIFESIGVVVKVDESMMDAITALSGSGPAYVFKLCEMMTAVGEGMNIPATEAELLSIQTIYGAAKMLKESGQAARELREAVTSKGGTTEAALRYLSQHEWDTIFTKAVWAAKIRSEELQPK